MMVPVMGTNYYSSSYNYHDISYNYFATTFEKVVITTS